MVGLGKANDAKYMLKRSEMAVARGGARLRDS